MCVVYMLSHGTSMRLSGGRFIIEREEKRVQSLLLHEVECVVLGRNAKITTPALYTLLENSADVFFVDGCGRVIARTSTGKLSFERMRVQHDSFNCQGTELARDIVRRKLTEQIKLLRRYAKTHHNALIRQIAEEVNIYRSKLSKNDTIEKLRGLEGIATRSYFAAFPALLAQERWTWTGRNRRPPRDPVNALLSYGYALLERDVRIGIVGAKLDESFGFFHANNGRKDSLVYDLMEPFRPSIIDHLILRMLNLNMFKPSEFVINEEGCRIDHEARQRFIRVC